jgi:RNA polymerase sigma-70 factor, ECF subfamily
MDSPSPKTFNELFLEHQRGIFAYIITLLPDRNNAEDVFQQTCLMLLQEQARYDRRREFFPWACGFALNEVRRFRRAHYRERLPLSDAVVDFLAGVQAKSSQRITAQTDLLSACLEELPAEKRDLLMHCYARQGGLDGIAAQLRLETTVLRKRLERIRRTVFECMTREQ